MGPRKEETLMNPYAPVGGCPRFHLSWELTRVGPLTRISGDRGIEGLGVLLTESYTGDKRPGQESWLVPGWLTRAHPHSRCVSLSRPPPFSG